MSDPNRGPPQARRQLYFAYGSNLWLQQMATRCPESRFVGRAVLPDYHWQINERGFANIIPGSGYSVHGLVYALGAGDVARLDHSEGVSSGCYSKVRLPVVLHEAHPTRQLPTWQYVDDGKTASSMSAASWQPGYGQQEASLQSVLVYLSKEYIQSGYPPRVEYVDRMNYGIRDAVALGIPEAFFQNAVRPFLSVQPLPPTRTPQPVRPVVSSIARRSSRSVRTERRARPASEGEEAGPRSASEERIIREADPGRRHSVHSSRRRPRSAYVEYLDARSGETLSRTIILED